VKRYLLGTILTGYITLAGSPGERISSWFFQRVILSQTLLERRRRGRVQPHEFRDPDDVIEVLIVLKSGRCQSQEK
jgi:hypothetical protein